jgi:hypothetical protein
MSKKQIFTAVQMASNLCKDTAGNLLSGSDLRAMGYLKALQHTLAATLVAMEAGSDVRAEIALKERLQDICKTLDAEHEKAPFDKSGLQESFQKWEAAGYKISDFRRTYVNEETVSA